MLVDVAAGTVVRFKGRHSHTQRSAVASQLQGRCTVKSGELHVTENAQINFGAIGGVIVEVRGVGDAVQERAAAAAANGFTGRRAVGLTTADFR